MADAVDIRVECEYSPQTRFTVSRKKMVVMGKPQVVAERFLMTLLVKRGCRPCLFISLINNIIGVFTTFNI